jgi:hypothetical protein
MEARARRRAASAGLKLVKGRASKTNPNPGGFQLLDKKGKIVAGENFELSLEDVLARFESRVRPPEPTGVLGKKLRLHCELEGCSMDALTVLSNENDPYRHDNERGHRSGQWFAEMVERFVPSNVKVHLRGMHYRISSAGDVERPRYINRCLQWTAYVNDFPNWQYVSEDASDAARWLGYVPFDRIVDERNAPPEVYTLEDLQAESFEELRQRKTYAGKGMYVGGGLIGDVQFSADIWASADISYLQPCRIVQIGEKSSLRPVLGPIAERVQGELLLPNGELSITHLYDMCLRASLDPRPLIVLYFSDFDPSGYHMPTNVARRIQALRDLCFPDLKVELRHVALTLKQAQEYDLPSTPLKETELRGERWKERWGHEQTEIDALAALQPEVLREIAYDAVRPYFDLGAAERAAEREEEWRRLATEKLHASPLYGQGVERLEEAKAGIEEAIEEAREIRNEVEQSVRGIKTPPIKPIELELGEATEDAVYDSDDDWVDATRKLKERKGLVADEGEE